MNPFSREDFRQRGLLSIVSFALAYAVLASPPSAQAAAQVDPPPVDETALVKRLLDMTKPSSGERAIILYDPTYYPGITNGLREALHAKGVYTYVIVEETSAIPTYYPGITTRLREALHAKGVYTYAIVEETPAMIAEYIEKDVEHTQREDDVVTTLLPMFKRSDIFYWMPVRGYADDLRWERLVADSRVRSVHFHWLLPFPGRRTLEEILALSRQREQRALNIDLADHARKQEKLAATLRGQTIRITTPGGTDLSLQLRRDQWFHFGNGDASRKRAATARSVRDREIELPVGFFIFVPPAASVNGSVVASNINQAGGMVRDVRFRMRRGLMENVSAAQGDDWIRKRIADIGNDGNKIASVWLYTHPLDPSRGVEIEIGSNWEVAEPTKRNGATRMRRMSMAFPDATLTAGGKTIVRDGRILWDEL